MRLAASAVSLASARFARAATSRDAARRANRAARPARRPLAAPRAAAASSSAGEEPESSGATVPFDETEGGEGASGHDVVKKEGSPAPPPSPSAPPTTSPTAPAGWGATPEDAGAPGAPGPSLSDASVSPGAYFRGRAGYSKFYPPDAREATFARHLMVAVDDSEASEAAVRWSIANLCRSGDLLHVVHVSAAGEADPRALPGYVGPPDPRGVVEAEVGSPVDFVPGFGPPSVSASAARHRRMIGDEWAPKALHGVRAMAFALDADTQDAYWSAAVLRTEAMLDDIFDRVKKNHGETAPGGTDMTPFPQPVELDAVMDTTWEPVAEVVRQKAERCGAEMLVVAHHSKNWWEDWLAGSVAKYLIDKSDLNVVVVH